MNRETVVTLAEAFLTEAEEIQNRRDRTDAREAAALNLTLRGQIMRDMSAVLRRAAQNFPPPGGVTRETIIIRKL